MASGVAAAGAAVAFYFYSRRVRMCGFGGRVDDIATGDSSSHFEGAYQAPSTWVEALYFFAEALRYMYNESLGRWRTADLLIGLAYLARQETAQQAVADIACTGHLVGQGRSKQERLEIIEEWKRIAHFMKYCQALRERRLPVQTVVLSRLGIAQEDILMQQAFAGMLKPSYVLVRDHRMRCVVLAIRGTHSMKDMFTSLTSASKPHHMMSGSGVILGYSHFGMLAAARWVMQQTQERLREAMEGSPGYHLQIVGHSLGAGTAALLTTRLRESGGVFAEATCLAIACPACMTMELARSCSSYVTTIINGHDMIPTLSPGAADALREEVMQSSWYEAFRADMRSNVVVRAVEASLGGVGSVTSAASSWTSASLSTASRSLRACYQRRGEPALKRSGSDADRLAMEDLELSAAEGRVEVARDWADPKNGAESPAWTQILQLLEPLKSEAQAQPSTSGAGAAAGGASSSWPSPSWSGRWESGTSEADSQRRATSSMYRRAGEFWSKLWLQGCRVDRRMAPFQPVADVDDPAASDAAFDSLESPLPATRMQMARSGSEGAIPDGGSLARQGSSFREELEIAEEDVAACPDPSAPLPGAGCDGVGQAGEGPLSPSPEKALLTEEERKARRMTYPAGRIYHLVPARLVFGEEGDKARQRRSDLRASSSMGDLDREELEVTEEAHLRQRKAASPPAKGSRPSSLYEGVVGYDSPTMEKDPYVVISTSGSKRGGARGLAPPIPPTEDYVLLEDVPQEVYGRIRLCRNMLADHFIPSYLGSLETALAYIETGCVNVDA